MKYIKKFEKLQKRYLKKYIVLKYISNEQYFVLELIYLKDEYDDIDVIKRVEYDKYRKKQYYKINKTFTINLYNSLFEFIYTSNDIDDCITFVEAKINSDKYNL
jgi:hypothetical protein